MGVGDGALLAEELTKVFRPPEGLRRALMRSPITRPTVAVDHIDLDVRRGEVFGLLGPNGAGKTTLIKLLTTLLLPTSGRALVCGKDVVREAGEVRSLVGFVTGEERSFYYRLTGRQNLEFFASLGGVPSALARRRISDALELLAMSEDADDMYFSYSSGMRQKLSLARCLIGEPRLLFLDEPTRNVDAITGAELKRLVKEELSGDSGRTILLATHRMEEAEQLCDRIAIVNEGRVLFCGTIAELRVRLGAREEWTVHVEGVEMERCLAIARGHVPHLTVARGPGDGRVLLLFRASPDGRQLSRVLEEVLVAGGTVVSCDRRERRLEDMFLDVVRGEARAC